METLFGRIAGLLDRISDRRGQEDIGSDLMRREHDQVTEQLEEQLTEFVRFLKTILKRAREDARFLRRHRDSIADLFSQGELRAAFLTSAETGIDDERKFLDALDFLDDLAKRSHKLAGDLKNLSGHLQAENRDDDKTLALLESCRMRAQKLHEDCAQVSRHIPGLRELDATQARKLGMLARSLKAS